jgi:hypothetical protein
MQTKAWRGQGATEYLVLLAIVLVICLVSVSLLNFFPGFSYEATKSESDYYWKTAKPFQIIGHNQQPGTSILNLVIVNGQSEQLYLTGIEVNGTGASGEDNTSTYLSGGETRKVNITLTKDVCVDGGKYEYDILLVYQSADGALIYTQYGEKRLVGQCKGGSGGGGGGFVPGGGGGVEEGGGGEVLPPTCGRLNQGCCPPAGTCISGLVCRVGSCQECGEFLQTCCNNNECDEGNICLFGTCV